VLDELLKSCPNHQPALITLALTCRAQGDLNSALNWIKRAAAQSADFVELAAMEI